MTSDQDTQQTISNLPVVVDVRTSPLPLLSFEDVIIHRLDDLGNNEQHHNSKLKVYADDILHQAISIIEEHNTGRIKRSVRFFLFLYGYAWIGYSYDEMLTGIKDRYLSILHSDDSLSVSEAMHPGHWALKQDVSSRDNAPIYLYLYQDDHEEIERIPKRYGIGMSDYAVVCLWAGVLQSDAPLPERVREHGRQMINEFKEKLEQRSRTLSRIRDEMP